ncbi:unnamed protein product [Mucor hiemalis]
MYNVTKTSISTTTCVLYPIATIPLIDEELLKEEQALLKKESNITTNINIVLPPTPTASDDEQEEKDAVKKMTQIKLARRGTVSLADLIPVASAALKAKHRLSMQQEQLNNPPPTQDSPLARALTKVRIGVQTHRIKERYLTNEWIRLALAAPIDESTINRNVLVYKVNRTKEIVKWYEHKFKRLVLTLEELEKRVDELRQQRLLLVQQHSIPASPKTQLKF